MDSTRRLRCRVVLRTTGGPGRVPRLLVKRPMTTNDKMIVILLLLAPITALKVTQARPRDLHAAAVGHGYAAAFFGFTAYFATKRLSNQTVKK